MAVEVGDGGDPRGFFVGYSGNVAWPIARVFFHESRRPGAENLFRCASQIQNTVQIQRTFLRVHGYFCSLHSRRRRWRNDKHRNAIRLNPSMSGRLVHPGPKSRTRTRLSSTGSATRCDARNHHLWRNDLRPGLDELDATTGLVGNRPDLLLQLRKAPQPYQCTAARNARRHSADALIRYARQLQLVPANPRFGLLAPNPGSAPVRLASFSLSASSKARRAAAMSESETSSLQRILFCSGLSRVRSSPLNARF